MPLSRDALRTNLDYWAHLLSLPSADRLQIMGTDQTLGMLADDIEALKAYMDKQKVSESA